MATLKDIAKRAGVSFQTVSTALNNPESKKLSAKKRELIYKIAEELNYKPNLIARGLRTKRSGTIGIIFPSNTELYYAEIINHMQEYLIELNLPGLFTFQPFNNQSQLKQIYEIMRGRNVDGVITYCYDRDIFSTDIPTLLFSEDLVEDNLDSIHIDFDYAFNQAFKYFKELGHNKVGYIGNCRGQRFQAYLKMLDHFNIPFRKEWTFHGWGEPKTGDESIHHYMTLKERPTAIIAFNDIVAISAINTLQRHNQNVPRDVSIIGFDNISMAEFTNPKLTTFNTNTKKTARLLIDTLRKRLDNPDKDHTTHFIKPELLTRESCSINL